VDSTFVQACRRGSTSYTPVWYMRQAGRYLPEYRALRESHGILDICRTPELASWVTMLPVRRLGVDAAILFSDIMIPVAAMGVDLCIDPGKGPVIAEPIRSRVEVERLRPIEASRDLPFIAEVVEMLAADLEVPLIGFCGAPFTLASYLIEGGASRRFDHTKALMRDDPETWHELMRRLADAGIASLRAQVGAGASAAQVFDSWVGTLSPAEYEEHALPHSRRIFEALVGLGVPLIHFGTQTGELLELMRDAGADVVGVASGTPMDEARRRLGSGVALQGNLDPAVLLAGWDEVERAARDVIERAGAVPGFIFNLGHGVRPETDPDVLRRLTDFVHEETAK